jgi:hypothetical protein
MTTLAIRCTTCGGAVAQKPGESIPRCLFCDSEALEPVSPEVKFEAPEVWLPFEVDESGAAAFFRAWTRSSIWMPSDLRRARVELRRLMLPAWVWEGQLETHWAGLISAMTRSGKRPISGQDSARFDAVLVPSSTVLSRAELSSISPFRLGPARDLAAESPKETYEIGGVTRRGARAEALAQMRALHAAAIQRQTGAMNVQISTLEDEMEGRPLLLPVYIGVFRRNEKFYRVVINGQSGAIAAESPVSWLKILAAVAGLAALIFILLVILTQ